MKYSESLWWFENVRWDEENCFIDCLVDIENDDLQEGYFLIEENGQLKISLCNLKEDKPKPQKILGRAKQWIVDF